MLEFQAIGTAIRQSIYGSVRLPHRPPELHAALEQIGRNQEMKVYTDATYAARELALERMQAEAIERGGIGVVGARVEEFNWGWGANAIEFFALGTAVALMGDKDRPRMDAVQQEVTFDDKG